MNRQVNDTKDGQVFCDNDSSPALAVSKILTLQQNEDDQQCHIFQTKTGIRGRSIKVIIDRGSCHNLVSEELRSKLHLSRRSVRAHIEGSMVERLRQHISGAHSGSIFQDRRLWRHIGMWCSSHAHISSSIWTSTAIWPWSNA